MAEGEMQVILNQESIFDSAQIIPIDYYEYFFKEHCNDKSLEMLQHSLSLNWTQNSIKTVRVPRLETLYGDPGIHYSYAGVTLHSNGWDPWLLRLRNIIQELSGHKFNYAIGNMYRNEDDSIGWHDDRKPELGEHPAIASVSLGATRKFQYRKKPKGEVQSINLSGGSLLLMLPGFQEDYYHQLPKSKESKGIRVNWTFRNDFQSKH